MMMDRRKFLIAAFIFSGLVMGAAVLVPWKTILEGRIISALEARGFSPVNLHVSGLGINSVVLSDITFGAEDPVTLHNVKVEYSLAGLRSRQMKKLTISSPSFVLRHVDGRWVIAHLGKFQSSAKPEPVSVASLTETLNKIPFEQIVIEKGTVRVETESWALLLPLDAVFDRNASRLSYRAENARFRKGSLEAVTGKIDAYIQLNKDQGIWEGDWNVDRISVQGAPAPVPDLKGQGRISAMGAMITADGSLRSDQSHHMRFRYEHSFDSATESVFLISSAAVPWKEGALKVEDVKIPLKKMMPVQLNVQVDRVSIDELLGAMTGQRVAGTGTVSGTIPVTMGKEGDLKFGSGSLTAAGPGKINMPADAIPGDNEQIALLRDILANLNYTALSISLNGGDNLGVIMSIEGNNPDVYNGRAIKLNVNLSGDVLDFIQQNVMLLTRPETLLEDGADE